MLSKIQPQTQLITSAFWSINSFELILNPYFEKAEIVFIFYSYIYIPWISFIERIIGLKRENGELRLSPFVKNIITIVGAGLTFIFVLVFHGWESGTRKFSY